MKRNCLFIFLALQICLLGGETVGQETKGAVEKPYVPEIEGIDDAGPALQVARERLGKMVPNASKLYRAMQVEYDSGQWLCIFIPRETWNRDWVASGLRPVDYVMRVDPKTREIKVNDEK